MKRGKHASNRIVFFSTKKGKHSKNELVVYNPLYAKFSACISSLAITTSFFTCLTFGKYKETWATSDIARPAKYLLNLTSSETSITRFIPETRRSLNFYVSNFEGEVNNPTAQNEVLLRYFIKIQLPETINLPLDYKLYKIENDVETSVDLNNGQSEWIQVSKTSKIDTYRLDIIWETGENENIYQNLTDNIKILIESEQIDE